MSTSLRLNHIAALLLLIITPLFSACSSGSGSTLQNNTTANAAKLITASDSTVLIKRLKAELAKRYQRQEARYYMSGMKSGGALPPVAAANGTPADATTSLNSVGGSASTAHSNTNTQEIGVDEGDLVKTDGTFIYLARGSHFLILSARPADQTAIISDLDLQEQISELYLNNGRVTLITTPVNNVLTIAPLIAGTTSASPVFHLHFYDVSVPAAPSLTLKYEFPGTLQGSRRINDTMYVISNHRIDLPKPATPWDYLAATGYTWNDFDTASAKATTENLKQIDALTLTDLLPAYSRTVYTGDVAGAPFTGPIVNSTDISYPESGNGTDLSLVIAIDTSTTRPTVTSSGVLSSWCRLYMSTDALYLTSGNDWFWIEPVAGITMPTANPEPSTAIHKFSVANGVGKPLYRGSGVVNGWVNDQFSLGEYNGYLRIGTTRGGWWGEGISNQLAIFSEQNGNLVETGRVDGIAAGEKIYSMRFDRNRGYMVTFRRTDPLFTFDLSDPKKPFIAGEIKVNGFATYIHLIGPDNSRLLTVGQSADATGRVTGNKLQLFDVANLATPLLLGDYELGSGWSTALYDYHSFLYYEPLGLLAIPYYDYSNAAVYSSALRLFDVNPEGIVDRGIIPAEPVSSGYGTYADTIDRAVIIGTDIYSIAHRSVTVADASTLTIKKRLQLPEGYWFYALMQPVAVSAL